MTDDSRDPAACFAEVTSGVYRRVDVESVWSAIEYAVTHRLPAENPTIMFMFIRIAGFYPQVHEHLVTRRSAANHEMQLALELILNPPEGLRNAEYLPEEIQSPGEMDLLWSEFLVTGLTEPIEKVVSVLDREDRTRPLLHWALSSDDSDSLAIGENELAEFASIGVALGKEDGRWQVVSPGDLDILLWFGVKDQKPTCLKVFQSMSDGDRIHIANKGAAMWSLKANASQHGTIRLFCEEQSKVEGGRGRLLINPSS
jgi:hypothetical protein